jgi:hypothetical protein
MPHGNLITMRATSSLMSLVAVLAVAATGCTDFTGAPAPERPSASSTGPIAVLPLEFSRTGGFAGVQDNAVISADGLLTVSRDGTTGKPTPLGAAQLGELRSLLSDPALAVQVSPPADTVCNDGYVHQVRTPNWTATGDDCTNDRRPAFDRLVGHLTSLMDTARPTG